MATTKRKRKTPERAIHPLAKAFSDWLTATRTRKGVTRYAMAKSSGMRDTTLKALEDQAFNVKLTTFVGACQALGENPGRVLNGLIKEANDGSN